jgi:hypothetical protein
MNMQTAYRRSFAFQRLSSPAVLWYFLTILLAASTVMMPRIEAEILLTLLIAVGATEGRHSALKGLSDGIIAGLFIGILTVFIHTQGSHVVFSWRIVHITSEGILWALCLGLGMVIIVLAARLQMNAMQHVSLGGLISHISIRAGLLCQMALAMIPSVGIRFRQLFELEKRISQSHQLSKTHSSHSSWLPRLQPVTYAVLAEALADSSHRTLALTLLGPAPRPMSRELHTSHPRMSLITRSWIVSLLDAFFFAILIIRPWGAASWTLDVSAILLVGIPFIAEGGGRLWSLLRR